MRPLGVSHLQSQNVEHKGDAVLCTGSAAEQGDIYTRVVILLPASVRVMMVDSCRMLAGLVC